MKIKDRTIFQGRIYKDFQELVIQHFAEMDTVHSSLMIQRSHTDIFCFLTKEKLFLTFIMNIYTKGAVKLIFDKLERQLGTYYFQTLFNIVLTDCGIEFGDPDSLESSINSYVHSNIYYKSASA